MTDREIAESKLTKFAEALADEACQQINVEAQRYNVNNAVGYPAQFTLEKLILILQERV